MLLEKKILDYESGTHNFVHSIEVRGTSAKRAHEASKDKKACELEFAHWFLIKETLCFYLLFLKLTNFCTKKYVDQFFGFRNKQAF